jgi:hypothetical protein
MSRPKLSEHEIRDGERDAAPSPGAEAKPDWRAATAERAVVVRARNVGGRLMV